MYEKSPFVHQPPPPPAPLTVSQLNHQARYLLENQFNHIQVAGEVSNLARPASGHLYFTLKDASAQIKVALFRSRVGKFIPSNGDRVVVTGQVSLYEPRGDYQMIAHAVQPAGDGDLQQAYLRLKAALEKEGLFAAERKKPLPKRIKTIGVVTSGSGAAIHDILTVLKRRFPGIAVILYPVAVQGVDAGKQISQAIETANAWPMTDVLIVGRGGGSIEDLWAFNEEVVARAIAASELPIVSAVGHEVDFTIADFVADLRAATPSAAAELLSPDQSELMQTLDHREQQLLGFIGKQLQTAKHQTNSLMARLRHPGDRIGEQKKLLNQLQTRLAQARKSQWDQYLVRLRYMEARLQQQHPVKTVRGLNDQVTRLQHGLSVAIQAQVQRKHYSFQSLVRALQAISPLSTLERGYAIAQDKQGKALTDSDSVAVGDQLQITLHRGTLTTEVIDITGSKTAD